MMDCKGLFLSNKDNQNIPSTTRHFFVLYAFPAFLIHCRSKNNVTIIIINNIRLQIPQKVIIETRPFRAALFVHSALQRDIQSSKSYSDDIGTERESTNNNNKELLRSGRGTVAVATFTLWNTTSYVPQINIILKQWIESGQFSNVSCWSFVQYLISEQFRKTLVDPIVTVHPWIVGWTRGCRWGTGGYPWWRHRGVFVAMVMVGAWSPWFRWFLVAGW